MFFILMLIMIVGMTTMAFVAQNLGYRKGFLEGARSVPRAVEAPKIECLCQHGPNFHKDGTGACDQTVEWELRGPGGVWEKRTKCRCTKYTGPEYSPLVLDMLQLTK